ncbi:VWA domain-containing protein [Lentisphaera profundi]|uniref:VWA domain-containing protein n=1 Tax=Lentisphaera profundi TaxID=1658616 RepID=A0ABY7W0R6_9BACT|nr:VWA domain-containing protein [Lentisphaera profundi]WDE97873.1 VWA domain-containing protein [Lentisphaera profundi]
MTKKNYTYYLFSSVIISLAFHALLALLFSTQLKHVFNTLQTNNTKPLPKEQYRSPAPKVTKWKAKNKKELENELKNALRPSLTPAKIDLNDLKINADIAPKVDSSSLAELQMHKSSQIPGQSLSTQLPPQIYEIKPLISNKHLSEANKSLIDQRLPDSDDIATEPLSFKANQGNGIDGSGSGTLSTPSITLPVNSIRPTIQLSAPTDPRKQNSLSLINKPSLPQISVNEQTQGQLDDVLKITPQTYIDPRDQQGYFRVDITLDKNSKRLISQAKEIMFILDTSTSIRYQQFTNFTYAIKKGIESLSPQDRFNIVTFNIKDRRCFPDYAPANEQNITRALDFLSNTKRGGKTDVYKSLRPYISQGTKRGYPRIIYLASDGNTTRRGGIEGVEIISKITQENQARTSIFAISNGDDTSPFLLDLLTLRNRGFSTLQEEPEGSGLMFENFIKTYSDTVVSQLNYRFSSQIDSDEIFPKELPHLYRGGTLSIYGKFNPNQNSTLVQVKGQGAKGLEEITFKIDFKKSAQGGASLAQNWGHHKILYLLGELTDDPTDTNIKNQLRHLVNKFNIPIPYEIK